MASRPSTKKKSAAQELGLKLLQSVREMKAGQAARTTKIENTRRAKTRRATP